MEYYSNLDGCCFNPPASSGEIVFDGENLKWNQFITPDTAIIIIITYIIIIIWDLQPHPARY